MKTLWCWRCKMDIPMLDEEEYSRASELYKRGFRIKGSLNDRFKELRDYYEKLTGFRESNHNAIMHHRISLYGPPCENCGKPYRTPKASFCAACGNRREQPVS